jgi:hypothetical protein
MFRFMSWPFTLEERALSALRVGSWVCPRTVMEDVEKRTNLAPTGFEIPRLFCPLSVAIPTALRLSDCYDGVIK